MSWTVRSDPETKTVTAVFEGHLTSDAGAESSEKFAETLEALETADAVFDVQTMTGYDSGARAAWQKNLFPHRKKIRAIRLVGGSLLIRMGASVLAMALGVPLETE